MINFRPCGACAALVPAGGCRHWRPKVTRNALAARADWREGERRARDSARAAVAAFREVMTR